MKKVHLFDRQLLPVQEVYNAHITRSESGALKLKLNAPRIVKYDKPTPKTIYPEGVELQFYDASRNLRTSLTAKYALSLDDRNIMEARDSVVVIDYSAGDTVYLENIIWNQDEDRMYSNKPLRAINGARETYGDGFVSDGKMENLRILHQRGKIEFNE